MPSNHFIRILSLDVIAQTVCVGEEQVDVVSLELFQHEVVMEVIHQVFGLIQHTLSNEDGFVQYDFLLEEMNSNTVLIEDGVSLQSVSETQCALLTIQQFEVDSVSDILHRLAVDRVVHQFEEIFFEVILGSRPLFSVLHDVALHEVGLGEFENSVDLSDLQS